MSSGVKQTDFSNKVLDSITGNAENVHQEMLVKRAEYEASMKKVDVFTAFKNKMFTRFKSAQMNSKNQNDSNFLSAKAQYSSALSSYSSASMDSDILRDSYNSSIFYSAKMNNSAMIAQAALT